MGSRWVDVREYPEYAAGHIAGSQLFPLGGLLEASKTWDRNEPLTLVCKSGSRAEQARQQLGGQGFSALDVLAGGVDAWREGGKPLVAAAHQPWAMERQVRTVAGSLVVVTLALGYFGSPYFLLGTAFVGAGLVFAGVSDTCMMATVLGRMPWNRPVHA